MKTTFKEKSMTRNNAYIYDLNYVNIFAHIPFIYFTCIHIFICIHFMNEPVLNIDAKCLPTVILLNPQGIGSRALAESKI